MLLSFCNNKKNLILLTNIEFYTLTKYKFYRKMLFYHIKNNNIMLSDNIKPQYTNDKRKSNKFFFWKRNF